MYKKHKRLITVLFVLIFILSLWLKADYSKIAEANISIMAIAIAVYTGATSVILGSPYATQMKAQPDKEIKTKTSLGVLASYLRTAGAFAIATIVVSTIYALNVGSKIIGLIPSGAMYWDILRTSIPQMASSFACGLFAINIVFMYLILIFLINSMTKYANYSSP